MPLTRALSARLRSGSHRQPATAPIDGPNEDVVALKSQAKAASSSTLATGRALVAGALAQLDIQSSGKGSSSSSSSSASTTSIPTRPRYVRGTSSRFSSRSSNSSRRSILGSSEFGDSSDDENDSQGNSRRLGGCSSFPTAADRPDDSNKENVAPFRCASQDVLEMEARDAQEEDAIRRTTTTTTTNRSRQGSLMERPTFARRLSRSSTTSDLSSASSALTMPRTPSRRLARATSDHNLFSSSPSTHSSIQTTPTRRPSTLSTSTRKRSRNDVDFDADDASLPASPLSRLRLQTPTARRNASSNLDSPSTSRFIPTFAPDEDFSSYFPLSSQESAQSSLFDTHSIAESSSAPTSSCSSSDRDVSPPINPALLDAAEQQEYSSVYAHARALLRYAAGVDPAETEAGLTITNAAVTKLGGHHVKVVGRESERVAIQLFLQQTFGLFADAPQRARTLNVELDGDAEAACLYVCGLPGTGKTALVRSVLNSLSEPTSGSSTSSPSAPRVAFVNCMTLSHPRLIFGKVLQALGSNAAEGQSDAVAEQALSTLIRDGNQRILIVLDEMDHLLQSRAHQNILYRIFSWTANCSGNNSGARGGAACSLIGIANSLDLTERFVPLLASRGASPALLHFRPFEASEIVSVIRDRLSGLYARYDGGQEEEQSGSVQTASQQDSLALFTPTAVELLAKKIAGATGDLRKALDAARLAVEMVESEQRKKAAAALAQVEAERVKALAAAASTPTEENGETVAQPVSAESAGSAAVSSSSAAAAVRAKLLRHLTPVSAPKVGPTHILKVLTSVLGSPNLSKVRALGVHPKLVLLSILIAQARAEHGLSVLGTAGSNSFTSSASPTSGTRIADVESTYHAILKQEHGLFSPLEGSELLGVFDMLEVNGVIRIASEVDVQPRSTAAVVVSSSGVSPSGKRAAKKQLLAGSRQVYLAMSPDDVQRGICTSSPGGAAAAGGGVSGGNTAVADTIARVYAREKDRAVKAKAFHSIAQENARIRQDELGGGRMGVPVGSF